MAEFKLRNAPLYAGVIADQRVRLRNAPVYVAVQTPPVLEVRNVRVFALADPEIDIKVRNVRVYALIAPAPLGYLAKKGEVSLLEAVNKEYVKNLTDTQVYFENPRPLVGDTIYNSQVTMKPKESFPYSGTMVFRYNRFDVSDYFNATDTSILPAGTQTTIHGRLASINATFGCSLLPRDVVDGPVASNATGLRLTIASTSFLFNPGSTQVIGTPPSGPEDLSSIGTAVLSGFTKVT